MATICKPLILFLFINLIFLLPNSYADTIKLAADEWPPYNITPNTVCDGATDKKDLCEGYMIDIARKVFEAEGHKVEYYVLPWKRAISETQKGNYTGLVGADKSDGKGFIFPKAELSINTLSFYVRKGTLWTYTGPSSLRDVSLGVVNGYGYRKWLAAYIQKHKDNYRLVQIMHGGTPLEKNIKKLVHNRVDAIVDSEATIRYVAKRMGYLDDIIPAGYGTEPNYIYIVFSTRNPKSQEYAKTLTQGIKTLRENGQLQIILDKYGLTDWRK